MRALVTYGSKMGGTRGLAEWLADELNADGVPTELVRLLHGCVDGVRTLADAIGRRLFVHVSDHSVWQ